MGRTEWQREIDDVKRRENWTLVGNHKLVKVVPYGRVMNTPNMTRAVGYVTQEMFLVGKTSRDIEIALGLQPFFLLRGCRVYKLSRLPSYSEFTYELTAAMPGGLAFNPADALEAHYTGTQSDSYYPAGSSAIPQWNVTVSIPLIHVIDLGPMI